MVRPSGDRRRPSATVATGARQGSSVQSVDWDQVFAEQLEVVYNYFRSRFASRTDVEQLSTAAFASIWPTRHRYSDDPAIFRIHLMASARLVAAESVAVRIDRCSHPDEPPAAEFAAKLRSRLAASEQSAKLRRRQLALYGVITLLVALAVTLAASSPSSSSAPMLAQASEPAPKSVRNPLQPTLESSARAAALRFAIRDTAQEDGLGDEDWDLAAFGSRTSGRQRRAGASSSNAFEPQPLASSRPQPKHSARIVDRAVTLHAPLPGEVRIGGSRLSVSLLTPSIEASRGIRSLRVDRDLLSAAALNKLCAGELDLAVISVPVPAEQRQRCSAAGMELIDLPVAFAAAVVLLNHDNVWADPLPPTRVLEILEAAGGYWDDIELPWPSESLSVHVLRESWGLGDFFDALGGSAEPRLLTAAFTRHLDMDDVLAAVLADRYAIAVLPFGTFAEHQNRLLSQAKVARIGVAAARPSRGAILAGNYRLAAPLFICIDARGALDPNLRGLVEDVLERTPRLGERPLFVPLQPDDYRQALQRLRGSKQSAPSVTQ